MNKKEISLICIIILLASLQLACSFTDIFSREDDPVQGQPQQNNAQESLPSGDGNSPSESSQENSQPAADQSVCTKSFSGSSNLSEGQEFQAGETIQVTITLINTGTCTWDYGYSLIQIGGDLSPSSSSLALSDEIAPSDSVQLSMEYTAPVQPGPYLSVWKMEDSEGGVFGQTDPPDSPLRIKIRSIASGNPQPTATPNPTPEPQTPPESSNPDASLEMDGVTLLDDHCYDLNNGSEVGCNDSKSDLMYNSGALGYNMHTNANSDFSPNQDHEPDKNACENTSYAPLPHAMLDGKFFCFRIESVTRTTYGWIRIERFDEEGVTFDFLTFKADPPIAAVNTNLFVETQGQQITLMEGQCYDVWTGQKNIGCSGIFAGFLFEKVTKKSLQVSQISPNEIYFAAAMNSEPNKTDCMNASYSTTSIWPIQATSYYCYQFVPGSTAYFGWLRPTSFNLGGLTFDYLTWQTSP